MEDKNQTAIWFVKYIYREFNKHIASGYPEEELEDLYKQYETTLDVLGVKNDQ